MEKESKYQKLTLIGQGAYGAVYKALHIVKKEIVALKISNFQECQEGVPSTCLRELSILKAVSHPNIVKLLDMDIFRGQSPRLEMAFEFLEYDLSKYLKKQQKQTGQRGLSETKAKKIIKDIMKGIQYLHSQSIMHRDLKPQNILISENLDIKIADLGLGRIITFPLQQMSREIQTLWYRAPELLLGSVFYDIGVDIWSIGCIFYQLVEGKILFQSDCQIGQIFQIFKILGTPRKTEWPEMHKLPDSKMTFPKLMAQPPPFKKLSTNGQQFLWRLLKANPRDRMSISQGLNDKYLKI